jgi:CRISPR/Cas system-associated exonuclease Cas4 (RecB family)
MVKDKYSAVWVSYSSISDYNKCPRLYYLKNIYRNPQNGRKISLMQPPLALGQAVHTVFEEISVISQAERFTKSLKERFDQAWQKIAGKRGGFIDLSDEEEFKKRGLKMMMRAQNHPGPLTEKAIKLRQNLPNYWLSETEGIILCGKIDWIRYDQSSGGVEVIDFKTGKNDEDPDSLQLPIYALLMKNIQTRSLIGFKYWYLERDDEPVAMQIPNLDYARDIVFDQAKRILLARKLERFVCSKKSGCNHCWPYELIISGRAEKVGSDNYNQDVYIIHNG